ncbi:MAG: fumarylacetoacetate hydrolase family protein [Ilumatobacter sp.]
MKWVTYDNAGTARVGIVHGNAIHDVDDDRTLLELLRAGPDVMNAVADAASRATPTTPFDQAVLHAPLDPPSVRDFLCFLDHYRNATLNPDLAPIWSEQPAFYFSNPHATIGPATPAPVSPGCDMFDFELEVACVIGTDGANLHPDEAEAHIAGYTIFCDWSARDLQLAEMQFGLGPTKGKDGATTLGPTLVTADELADRRSGKGFDLSMRAWVNDELVTDGSLAQLDWSFAEMVAHASRGTEVRVGDVIGSGTVPMGCLLEHAMRDGEDFRGWLAPGDRLRVEVELLGTLDLVVADPPTLHPTRSTTGTQGTD